MYKQNECDVGNNSTQSLISSAHVFSEVIMRGLGGNMHHCWGRHSSAFVSKVELENCPPPKSTSECQGSIEPIFWRSYTPPFPIPPHPHPHIHTQWDPHSPKSLILDSWLKIPHPGWVNCHMQGMKVCHSNLNSRPVLYFCTTYYSFFLKLLRIPDICHGRHGYTRVNFFWPV